MNWINKIPPFDSQFSNGVDVFDCVEESFCHIIFMLTGFRASPRALGKMVGVDSNGSGIYQCLYTALTHGLIPFEDWPTPESFTWDSYYSPIPPEVSQHVKFFDISVIDPDLAKSPLWTQLSFAGRNGQGSTLHWVAQVNSLEYFDSEPHGAIKSLTYGGAVVLSQHSLIVKEKYMGLLKTQNKGGELRIVIPATTPVDWIALCEKFGLDPKIINETI